MKTSFAIIASTAFAAAASAGSVSPFTETFDVGANGWLGNGSDPLVENATGGVDGSGYVSTSLSFDTVGIEGTSVLFRGNGPVQNASGGAFTGDWIASGVTNLSFDIRHNGPVPLQFFARIAGDTFGAAFPGAVAISFAPVFAGDFSTISIDIDPNNPEFVSFSGTDFETVLSNVGFLQIGVVIPDGFETNPNEFRFDLDNVRIVPTPAVITVFAGAGLIATRRRRG